MQNAGNDYIFLFSKPNRKMVKKLCNRNFGIGGDGVVYLYQKDGLYGYEIYNKDGSRATFCGSVTLALGLYLFKLKGETCFDILTDCGAKKVVIKSEGERVKVGVEVGKPHFQLNNFAKNNQGFNRLLLLKSGNRKIRVRATLVNVGNLHLVISGLYTAEKRKRIVEAINKSGLFENGVNVEFFKMSKGVAKVIVFERGSGKTLCCSSGASAVFCVLNKMKKCQDSLKLQFEGGMIFAKYKGKSVWIYGYPKMVFSGEYLGGEK